MTNVTVHESLKSVFELPDLAPSVSLASLLLIAKDDEKRLRREIAEAVASELQWKEITSDNFPSDNNEAVISDPGADAEIEVDWTSAEAISETSLLLGVSIRFVDCLADLYIFKSDFWSLAERKDSRFSLSDGDWNEDYVEAQTYVTVDVQTTIAVRATPSFGESKQFDEVEVFEIDDIKVIKS